MKYMETSFPSSKSALYYTYRNRMMPVVASLIIIGRVQVRRHNKWSAWVSTISKQYPIIPIIPHRFQVHTYLITH